MAIRQRESDGETPINPHYHDHGIVSERPRTQGKARCQGSTCFLMIRRASSGQEFSWRTS